MRKMSKKIINYIIGETAEMNQYYFDFFIYKDEEICLKKIKSNNIYTFI